MPLTNSWQRASCGYFVVVSQRELALFPLAIVLFPQAPMPLHIFEPRYRRLVEDCLAGNQEFGVLPRLDENSRARHRPWYRGMCSQDRADAGAPDGRSKCCCAARRFSLVRS